ncbi:MAG: BON domain-containing protein [Chthoniobacteraceae bacterium]
MKSILCMLLMASTGFAQTPAPSASATVSATPRPDDSIKKAPEELTVEQQGDSPADRELTRIIRRAVLKEAALSGPAKNVKIISIEGKVTLRGPVHSEQEKTMVGSIAEKAAGQGKVTNQLEVRK